MLSADRMQMGRNRQAEETARRAQGDHKGAGRPPMAGLRELAALVDTVAVRQGELWGGRLNLPLGWGGARAAAGPASPSAPLPHPDACLLPQLVHE